MPLPVPLAVQLGAYQVPALQPPTAIGTDVGSYSYPCSQKGYR